MNTQQVQFEHSRQRFIAYLLAVGAGVLIYLLYFIALPGSGVDLLLAGSLLIDFSVYVFLWISTALLAILPYRLGMWLSDKYALSNCGFYVAGAVLTSLCIMTILIFLPSFLTGRSAQPMSVVLFIVEAIAPQFVLSGAVAGLIYWWRLSR
ncbi:hypothetical protein VI06_21665 [Aquitalea magnusonii]|nr:hypothetical protein VI06_21665 [Aquitalea magnusonii]